MCCARYYKKPIWLVILTVIQNWPKVGLVVQRGVTNAAVNVGTI